MITAVVFDFDGLIIDSEMAVSRSWREVYERYGLEFPEDMWRTMVGTREYDGILWTELERLTGCALDVEALEGPRRRRSVEIANELNPLPGVLDLLDQARGLGLRTAIASSSSSWWVRGHLDRLGLAERFEAVLTREGVPRSKPHPDIYLAALAALGLGPHAALAFEDSAPGVAAAKAAQMRVVAVPGSFTEHMDFSAADRVVQSLEDVSLETLVREFSSAT